MSENQRKFLETINKLMPRLTELEQEKLLAFGEGLAFMNGMNERGQAAATERPGV
mgnify:CR=1 FL=1